MFVRSSCATGNKALSTYLDPVRTLWLISSELWVRLAYDISHQINTATPCRSRKRGKKKKHSHLNFNNVSYLNDWKWNYLAPAVFPCTPLLYFCKAICPLLLSNRATYPGSHLQTARKNWKRCSVLAETGRRSLWVLNCLNMHIMSRLPCEARPSAKWIINTTDLMLVWKMKHLALRRLHFEGFRVPYGFTSTFSSVVCKLMDKGDQLKLSPVAEKRRKKYLAKFFSLKRSQQTLAPPCFILWRNYHCLSWSEAH